MPKFSYYHVWMHCRLSFIIHRRLFALRENKATQEWHNEELFLCGSDLCSNGLLSDYENHILSFGEDDEGKCITDQRIPCANSSHCRVEMVSITVNL